MVGWMIDQTHLLMSLAAVRARTRVDRVSQGTWIESG